MLWMIEQGTLDIPRFSTFLIQLWLRLSVSSFCRGSRFSIFSIRFCCRYRHRSSPWWSRFSIFLIPLHSNQRHRSPVYSSRFSILWMPASTKCCYFFILILWHVSQVSKNTEKQWIAPQTPLHFNMFPLFYTSWRIVKYTCDIHVVKIMKLIHPQPNSIEEDILWNI